MPFFAETGGGSMVLYMVLHMVPLAAGGPALSGIYCHFGACVVWSVMCSVVWSVHGPLYGPLYGPMYGPYFQGRRYFSLFTGGRAVPVRPCLWPMVRPFAACPFVQKTGFIAARNGLQAFAGAWVINQSHAAALCRPCKTILG